MASSGSSQSSARNASSCSTSSSAPNVTLCCGMPVVKKRNTTSVVWDYFGLKAHSDGGQKLEVPDNFPYLGNHFVITT